MVGLAPGTYLVAALPKMSRLTAVGADEGPGLLLEDYQEVKTLSVYAGDTVHRKDAKRYTLGQGEERLDIAITIPEDALRTVRGTVRAVDGRPLNMGDVILTDESDERVTFETELRGDSAFVFAGIPPGTYRLKITAARIGHLQTDRPDFRPEALEMVPVTAFADATSEVIVGDHDLLDLAPVLTEIPMPKETVETP